MFSLTDDEQNVNENLIGKIVKEQLYLILVKVWGDGYICYIVDAAGHTKNLTGEHFCIYILRLWVLWFYSFPSRGLFWGNNWTNMKWNMYNMSIIKLN